MDPNESTLNVLQSEVYVNGNVANISEWRHPEDAHEVDNRHRLMNKQTRCYYRFDLDSYFAFWNPFVCNHILLAFDINMKY